MSHLTNKKRLARAKYSLGRSHAWTSPKAGTMVHASAEEKQIKANRKPIAAYLYN